MSKKLLINNEEVESNNLFPFPESLVDTTQCTVTDTSITISDKNSDAYNPSYQGYYDINVSAYRGDFIRITGDLTCNKNGFLNIESWDSDYKKCYQKKHFTTSSTVLENFIIDSHVMFLSFSGTGITFSNIIITEEEPLIANLFPFPESLVDTVQCTVTDTSIIISNKNSDAYDSSYQGYYDVDVSAYRGKTIRIMGDLTCNKDGFLYIGLYDSNYSKYYRREYFTTSSTVLEGVVVDSNATWLSFSGTGITFSNIIISVL